ncbi:MAG: M23 family metallopeptidase [Gammaproteobacteria bacterium]|nr:hypothetical protein [Gammaproteobacteria bacterium]
MIHVGTLVYASTLLVIAAACAGIGYRHGETLRAQRVVELKPELDAWRSALERDALRAARESALAERWVDELARELGRIEARVVHLESIAVNLMLRSGVEHEEFDFAHEPAVGGPEEAAAERLELSDPGFEVARLSRRIDDRWRQLRVLGEMLRWRDVSDAVRPEGRPVARAYVSSAFGPRIDPFTGRRALHKGVDFAGRPGTAVRAVAAGIVTWAGPLSGYGQMVEIDHGNDLVTRYAHNAENLVAAGDVVIRGQPIARLGSTGRATGPNLHFEVLRGGEAVDPLRLIE